MAESCLPSYYTEMKSWRIAESLRDFDDPANHAYFNSSISSVKSRNFLVDFGDDEAWCGFDLEAEDYTSFLKAQRPATLNTRWINVWSAHEQRDLLTALARHYDFSPRLLGFMCSAPLKPVKSGRSSKTSSSSSIFRSANRNEHESPTKPSPEASSMGSSLDVEESVGMTELSAPSEPDFARSLNQYALASEIWHYSSVDWGRSFICLGYNTLHSVEPVPGSQGNLDEFREDLPDGKRIWSWLLLCDDKTVITINEDAFPFHMGPLTHREQHNLGILRRNMINVFRQCSKARDPLADAALMRLPLRGRVGDNEEESQHRSSDTPGLLFYYLFDDWFTIYSLIARRDHRYAVELNDLRLNMLSKAELGHVDRLHHIGRQLSVLKRVYQGYELLIDRLLEKREVTLASLKNSNVIHSGIGSMASSHVHIAESQTSLGVSLSSAAKVRFERLKHRIQLYALNEVDDCMSQKESLVMMNFNLIAIKESYSVERLTRVTLLLAKATILFMPVSLLTAYFSCQFQGTDFTVRSYWAWFVGILAASIMSLIIFSLMSGTTERHLVQKPFSQQIIDLSKRVSSRRARKIQ